MISLPHGYLQELGLDCHGLHCQVNLGYWYDLLRFAFKIRSIILITYNMNIYFE